MGVVMEVQIDGNAGDGVAVAAVVTRCLGCPLSRPYRLLCLHPGARWRRDS